MRNLIVMMIAICGCSQPVKVVSVNAAVKSSTKDSIPVITNKCSNPVFFMGTGSTFIGYMQTLFRLGKFETMLDFTSEVSIRKFGRERLLKFYSTELHFGYTIGKLTSKSQSADTITMNFANSILYATKRVSRFRIIQEGDSCKLILNSLRNPF